MLYSTGVINMENTLFVEWIQEFTKSRERYFTIRSFEII